MIYKKSQAWGIDLFIGITIFIVGIMIFYFYAINSPEEGKEIVEKITYDGKFISNIVLSDGYPPDWNEDNVVNIGILTNNKINNTKLKNFYDMAKTSDGYKKTKSLFKTNYDYWFFLDDKMTFDDGTDTVGIGNDDYKNAGGTTTAKNLIKITRFVIYKDKPMTGYFYIYEK